MLIQFQDPDNDDAPSSLEAILEACEAATAGAGIFAFASRQGISLLFKDETFAKFLKRAPFELVVGIDSITNVGSLELLKEYAGVFPKLTVRAFHHKRSVTFHPKFCWFTTGKGGRIILGSGNLTPGGLSGNWEAFTRIDFDAKDAAAVATQWNDWKKLHAADLKAVDDAEVLERAKQNKPKVIQVPDADEEPLAAATKPAAPAAPGTADDVLIAEIPKAKDRWKQANFDLDHFRHFFHLEPGKTRRVFLWHVDAGGSVGPTEVRPSVSVKSKNYRIELAAAGDEPYPAEGRPIGVFLRTATRKFRYRLVMPTDPAFPTVRNILAKRWSGRADRMQRVTLSVNDLRAEWPASPL